MKNRRSFLKTTGLALAASTLPLPHFAYGNPQKKLGVALLGLGGYATNNLAPALMQTKHIELRGIVTGSPEKIPVWKEKYGIKDQNVYSYETLPEIANNEDIDVVYIVTPNFCIKNMR